MITPAEQHARALRELLPEKTYGPAAIGRVVGMHPVNVARAVARNRLAFRSKGPLRCAGSQVHAWTKARADRITAGTGVIATPRSSNMKLGHAATTIVARQSCPDSCRFKSAGCYAEHDNTRVHWDRVTAGAMHATPLKLAIAEADAIDKLPADRDLRLHVAGDSTTPEGTRIIAAACWRYTQRAKEAGKHVRVWGYTHAWRTVPRECWGRVSILASCESVGDVLEARFRGYATALVAEAFTDEATHLVEGEKVLPCPQQTRDRTCTDCRLCFGDARLRDTKITIGFSLHGGGTNKAMSALTRRPLPMAS